MQTRPAGFVSALIIFALLLAQSGFTAVASADDNGLAWLDSPDRTSADRISVVVFLDNYSVQEAVQRTALAPRMSRASRIKQVSNTLKAYRSSSESVVSDYLKSNSTIDVTRFWIVSAFAAELSRSQIETVAAMPGVKAIVPDVTIESFEPVEVSAAPSQVAGASSELQLLQVPTLWAQGITGRGRLVCSFDTGVEQDHPALSPRWRGNHAALSASWMSTVAPDTLPYDLKGHGTHTMGLMVGVAGADTIGVAPGAEWITAGVIDQGKSLTATISDILLAFEWALDPDGNPETTDDVPDVILNSWGVPASLFGPCDETFWEAIDNVEAAGIVTIFSAGNEGPDPQTLRNPANRASSPINCFSIGAVDNSKQIASFSSRGPSVCDSASIKPEVVAPGVSIRSCTKDGSYAYMSGTSMAAPYIAGLVALCRQYNPDATVEEIKWALIRSAEDLGVEGEDNDYGYGFVDASKLLDYLSTSDSTDFVIRGKTISGDGTAVPGEQFGMQLLLTNIRANLEQVTGRLVSCSEGVTVISESADFFFGLGGSAAINTKPFEIVFDETLYHGEKVRFTLYLENEDKQVSDSLSLDMTVGFVPTGSWGDHDAGRTELTVSDFGQYGLGSGSLYNVGGTGMKYDNGDNLLYEAGIVLGRNSIQIASSLRDSTGAFTPSDFVPVESLSDIQADIYQGTHRMARMDDAMAEVSIPVTVSQETVDYAAAGDEDMVIFKYYLINSSLEYLTNLHFGFMADFDLSDGADMVKYDPAYEMIYQQSASGPMVGLVALDGIDAFKSLDNGQDKVGYTSEEQFGLISSATDVTDGQTGDMMLLVSGGPYDLNARDSVAVALALVVADNLADLRTRAARAADHYADMPTDVDEDYAGLPSGYELCQNYPNPFNPTTTIEFSLPVAGTVAVEVFNVLGQRVKQLYDGQLSAGHQVIEWDGRNDHGSEVASGVYFYRLTADGFSQSKKMILLR